MKKHRLAVLLYAALAALTFGMSQATPESENGIQVQQIDYSYKGTRYLVQIALNAKAQAALAANPVETGKTGSPLVDALEHRGGVLQDVTGSDGTLVPSEQQFDEHTGKRTAVIYRRAGLQQDPRAGVAAVQGWDAESGASSYTFYFTDGMLQNPSPKIPASTEIRNSVTVCEYCQAGKLEDPQEGRPARRCVDKSGKCLWEGHYQNNLLQDTGDVAAWQEFDSATGHVTLLEYCQNGLMEDPAIGEPAKQVYDGKTGALISASRCSGGKATHVLDAKELAALAAKKNISLQAAPTI